MSINSVGSHKGDSGDYVTDTRRKGREITIVVVPTARRNGRYKTHLGETVLCVSSTKPFLDAARRLIALGFGPGITLVMRHAGSETECLRSTIGAAATLTVRTATPTLEAASYSGGIAQDRFTADGRYHPSGRS